MRVSSVWPTKTVITHEWVLFMLIGTSVKCAVGFIEVVEDGDISLSQLLWVEFSCSKCPSCHILWFVSWQTSQSQDWSFIPHRGSQTGISFIYVSLSRWSMCRYWTKATGQHSGYTIVKLTPLPYDNADRITRPIAIQCWNKMNPVDNLQHPCVTQSNNFWLRGVGGRYSNSHHLKFVVNGKQQC